MVRNPQLDFLRGIAVLMVIFFHMPHEKLSPLDIGIFGFFLTAGWSGVDLFFVLSGFLVSGLIFKEFAKTEHFKPFKFLVRRGFKIYPGFYTFIFLGLLLFWWQKIAINWREVLHEVFFVQNYTSALWNHTWSLAIEEHFYIGLSIIAFLLVRISKNLKTIPNICLSVMALSLVLRAYGATTGNFDLKPTHLRVDALSFGVLLSYYYHFHLEALQAFFRKKGLDVLAIGLVTIGLVWDVHSNWFAYTLGLTCLYLGFGMLLILVLHTPWPNKFWSQALRYIGVYSYSIYLWHVLIAGVILGFLKSGALAWPPMLVVALYVAIALGVGIGMAKLVEFPALALREKLVK